MKIILEKTKYSKNVSQSVIDVSHPHPPHPPLPDNVEKCVRKAKTGKQKGGQRVQETIPEWCVKGGQTVNCAAVLSVIKRAAGTLIMACR